MKYTNYYVLEKGKEYQKYSYNELKEMLKSMDENSIDYIPLVEILAEKYELIYG